MIDTDNDQMPDGWETQYGLDPEDPDDGNGDLDNDLLTNLEEYNAGTDPTLSDTDNDGFSDSEELDAGTDPLDEGSHPNAVPAMGNFGLFISCLILIGLGYVSIRRNSRPFITSIFICLAFSITALSADAAPLGPGWSCAQGKLHSHADAGIYYKSLSDKNKKSQGIINRTINAVKDFLGMQTTLGGDPAVVTPEITEFARALKHDPILIYEYVRNHVDYVPYFGSLKGATLTYLDGSGNDFDQASLMIALLRASDIAADYVYGQMTIPISGAPNQKDLQHWLCAFDSSDVIEKIFADGGIPATLSSPN